MRRREFVRFGAAAAGAPAVLPFLDLNLQGVRERSGARRRQDEPIRLSSNENPLGIPDSARQAMMDGFATAHRYPGGARGPLIEALAERHGVDTERIVLGAGSTEILQVAVQAVMRPELRIVTPRPTFEDVEYYSGPHAHEIEMVRVPLVPNSWEHDLEGMERVANRARGGALVYICNPNNPTGTLTPTEPLKEWIDRSPDHTFLIDEAYAELADDPAFESLDRLAAERPNVIVSRTFSKVFGLAGIRVGYAVAHPATASRLQQFTTRHQPAQPALLAAHAALQDEDFFQRSLQVNERSRAIVYRTLDELGLDYMPTQANLVFHEIRGDLGEYRQRMLDQGLAVGRAFPPFLDYNRVSLGLPEEMERWAEVLRGFRADGFI